MSERKHTITFTLDGEDLDYSIACPWAMDDPERPCRMFEDAEAEEPQKPLDGCGVQDWLDAGGREAIGTSALITSAPTPVEMRWTHDGPEIGPAPLVEPPSPQPNADDERFSVEGDQ